MKKIPMRTCVVCREKMDKRDLKRLVCNKEGDVFYDETGKANGRGAYLCNKPECLDTFLSKNVLERAFKRQFDAETVARVRADLVEKN